jgi:hypothetical protein
MKSPLELSPIFSLMGLVKFNMMFLVGPPNHTFTQFLTFWLTKEAFTTNIGDIMFWDKLMNYAYRMRMVNLKGD